MKKFRKIVTFILVLFPILANAQDTLFYNSKDEKVKAMAQADYYQTLVKESIDSKKLIERSYYRNGQQREEIYYLDFSQKKKEGTQRFWFRNGQLKLSVDYVDNKLHGNVWTYWQNGQIKRRDTFENNQFVTGFCYDSIGNKIEHFDFVVLPTFPGGEKMLLEFLKHNIHYPSYDAEFGIQGKVVVKFVVSKDGTPTKIGIKTSVDRDLDKEALRVVRAMPKWSPCLYDGEPYDSWFILPVIFRML